MKALLAILFLALSAYVGQRLCRFFLPGLDGSRMPEDRRPIATWVIATPLAFLCGTLLMTWGTYLAASLLRNTGAPMAAANVISMSVAIAGLATDHLRRRKRPRVENASSSVRTPARGRRWADIAVAATGLILGAALMFHTCRLDGDTLILGRTAFGDLNIHLGMARSFSEGSNFPTGYPAFAGSDVRYHFMFYFLVGNLEFLGLPLDWAVNLPSILSFASVLLLLYALGSVAGRDWRVGWLAVLFFLMRSSPAIFYYLGGIPSDGPFGKLLAVLRTNRYIGITGHEEWGIWNLNVYVVERHFAFAFGLVLIACLYLLRTTGLDTGPPLFRGFTARARTPESIPD